MALPTGPTQVVETGSKVPTVQVPQQNRGFTMSKRDQILLFSRDLPLSRQQSTVAQRANPQGSWAKSVNNLMVTTTTGITDLTQKVEKIAHDLLPASKAASEDGFVHLKAEIIIQKKLLVLDLTDLIADSGDDLAEVLGQHVTVQLVGTTTDPSKLPRSKYYEVLQNIIHFCSLSTTTLMTNSVPLYMHSKICSLSLQTVLGEKLDRNLCFGNKVESSA